MLTVPWSAQDMFDGKAPVNDKKLTAEVDSITIIYGGDSDGNNSQSLIIKKLPDQSDRWGIVTWDDNGNQIDVSAEHMPTFFNVANEIIETPSNGNG